MSTQHTPGPWTFSEGFQFGDTRFYIAQQEGAPYTPYYSDVATLIAETVSGERVTIQRANARLISAAPELLAFAQEFLADYRSEDGLDSMKRYAEKARAAIAKATGEAS